MTPMRQHFLAIHDIIQSDRPDASLPELRELLVGLITEARDTEEAGAAAIFSSAVLIFAEGLATAPPETLEERVRLLEIETQAMAAVMLLRQGRIRQSTDSFAVSA